MKGCEKEGIGMEVERGLNDEEEDEDEDEDGVVGGPMFGWEKV